MRQLARSPPDGVRFLPRDDDITEIHAEIHGPEGTPYEGGVWHVKLMLGSEYPAAAPKGYFLTKIYHPNVGPHGDICVNTLKKDWKPSLGLSHVLKVVWCLLIVPFPESSLNDEAGKLFMDNYDEYASKAKLMTSIHATKRRCTSPSKIDGGEKTSCDESGKLESYFSVSKGVNSMDEGTSELAAQPSVKKIDKIKKVREWIF